jgi:DNA repair protein RadC
MFHGTIDSASVYPREWSRRRCGSMRRRSSFRTTIRAATPSRARRQGADPAAQEALALVDVRTLDHIIVAGGSTISFAERGLI